jgi:Gpi18-like mannosyltransferase
MSVRTLERTLAVTALVVAVAALARMPFWLAYTHAYGNGDAIIWQVWARSIHEHGFINVLRTADSNNLGYHYVLWPTSIVYSWISPGFELWTPAFRVLIKIPPFLADLGITALVFAAARSLVPAAATPARRNALAAAAALAFALAPASIYDSMWWSQIDAINAICMLGAVMLLARGRVELAFAVWMLGFLAKPQPIVILPVLLAFTYFQFGTLDALRGIAAAALVFAAAVAPFVIHGDARLVVETYDRMLQQWPLDLAQGAWNGWSILDVAGDPRPGDALLIIGGLTLTYANASLALCAVATMVAIAWLRRNLHLAGLLMASAAMVFAFYMLPTSTHERYLYPMFALLAPLLVRDRRIVALYTVMSVTFILNLLALNPPTGHDFWLWERTPFAVAVAALNVAVYLVFLASMAFEALAPRRRLLEPPVWEPQPAAVGRAGASAHSSLYNSPTITHRR